MGVNRLTTVGVVCAAFVGVGLSTAAHADSVCVACDGPDATYICKSPIDLSAVRRKVASRALGYACVQQIARQNGHASCKVRLEDRSQPCLGQRFTLRETTVAPPANAAADRPANDTAPPSDPAQNTAEKTPEDRSPRTVVELAERTADASKRELKKAGRAIEDTSKTVAESITDAAKKSWLCVVSLFQNC
ncbi:MAG: hypothetical protein AAF732_23015 [Pseudomonadota bacterium]